MTFKLAAVLLMATAGVASAGGSEGSLGVGAESTLNTPFVGGIGGVSLNYDAGAFHVGGFLGLVDGGGDNDSDIFLGGRFYYHVHSTAMSDFSIGGTVGIASIDGTGPMNEDRDSLLFIEPGIQVRVFLQANFALSLGAGLSIGAADADGLALIGDATGSAGFHYYFF